MSVISKFRRTERETGNGVPVGLKDWQKIQNLFSRIIGADISFFDSSGTPLLKPSRITPFCSDLVKPLDRSAPKPVDCVVKALQESFEGRTSYLCPHRLHFLSLKIESGHFTGFIVIGPFLAGVREPEEIYRKQLRSLTLDEERFLDGLAEIKLFSHTSLAVIMDFLKDISGHYFNRLVQKQELKYLVPTFSSRERAIDSFFSIVYVSELSNSLLDIAMSLVKGDSGSVLLFDGKKKCFQMKAARQLHPKYMNEAIPLGESVAGWVVREAKPLLIQKNVRLSSLTNRLKRPEINSSFVIPIMLEHQAVGVLCLNSKSLNKKFNQDNLLLLGQLGKLASIALGRLNLK